MDCNKYVFMMLKIKNWETMPPSFCIEGLVHQKYALMDAMMLKELHIGICFPMLISTYFSVNSCKIN